MNTQDYVWLTQNSYIFNNVRLQPEDLRMIIDIYNRVTGDNMRMTGCARCIQNIKKRLRVEYDRYQDL